jgi:hypothetical protein
MTVLGPQGLLIRALESRDRGDQWQIGTQLLLLLLLLLLFLLHGWCAAAAAAAADAVPLPGSNKFSVVEEWRVLAVVLKGMGYSEKVRCVWSWVCKCVLVQLIVSTCVHLS